MTIKNPQAIAELAHDLQTGLGRTSIPDFDRLPIEPFEFPAWERFVELFRGFLDAPLLLGSVCLPLKDLAFREVSIPTAELDRRLTMRLESNSRIRQFILASASYLIEATRLPREFKEHLSKDLSLEPKVPESKSFSAQLS
jgi:hypothetical protein